MAEKQRVFTVEHLPADGLAAGAAFFAEHLSGARAAIEGADIKMAVPMKDAAGYFFVGIQLNDSGSRKLAQATPQMVGKQLVLVVDDRLLGAALIDGPIDKGVFAMATSDRHAAFILSDLLSPKSK